MKKTTFTESARESLGSFSVGGGGLTLTESESETFVESMFVKLESIAVNSVSAFIRVESACETACLALNRKIGMKKNINMVNRLFPTLLKIMIKNQI